MAAGVMGFFTNYSAKMVGGFAVLPTLIAFIAVNLKCEAKNSWHARRADGLERLRSQLIYEQPEEPTLTQVALVAKGKTELEAKMQKEWDDRLVLNWNGFARQGHTEKALPIESSTSEGK
ncbi:MAG: hypothetical protein WBF42_11800 [Terracidiphilus sp.]